jgi:hypothetical protein
MKEASINLNLAYDETVFMIRLHKWRTSIELTLHLSKPLKYHRALGIGFKKWKLYLINRI